MDGWKVKSNAESGEGYSDISVEVEDKEIGIIIEFHDRNYKEALMDDGMTIIRRYGIACYKKRCKVVSE